MLLIFSVNLGKYCTDFHNVVCCLLYNYFLLPQITMLLYISVYHEFMKHTTAFQLLNQGMLKFFKVAQSTVTIKSMPHHAKVSGERQLKITMLQCIICCTIVHKQNIYFIVIVVLAQYILACLGKSPESNHSQLFNHTMKWFFSPNIRMFWPM